MSFWPESHLISRGTINARFSRMPTLRRLSGRTMGPTDLSNADAIIVLLNHAGQAATDPRIKPRSNAEPGSCAIHLRRAWK